MARVKNQRAPSTQAINRLLTSSIGNWTPEQYPMVSVRHMAGGRRPRLVPNEMGGYNVATRPDPNEGLPDIAVNAAMDEDRVGSNIAGPGGFLMSRELANPQWGRFFDVMRQKGAVIGRDRRSGADWFSGPAESFETMKPGQYLTKTATDWSRAGRGQSGSNMASSLGALENRMYEDARREQIGERDKFRVAEDRRRGRRF